jgi:hypothetical protein
MSGFLGAWGGSRDSGGKTVVCFVNVPSKVFCQQSFYRRHTAGGQLKGVPCGAAAGVRIPIRHWKAP